MPSPECAASLSGSRQSRNSITDGPLGSSGREPQPHFFNDLPRRRHQPDDDLRSPVDNRLAVHENLVLAIASRDRIHLDPQLTAEARRHTDGMYSRDSERAITNRYSGHGSLPFGPHLLRNKLRDCPFRNRDRSGTARVEPEVGWRARHSQDHGITTRTSQHGIHLVSVQVQPAGRPMPSRIAGVSLLTPRVAVMMVAKRFPETRAIGNSYGRASERAPPHASPVIHGTFLTGGRTRSCFPEVHCSEAL